jgi:hypothetical protein
MCVALNTSVLASTSHSPAGKRGAPVALAVAAATKADTNGAPVHALAIDDRVEQQHAVRRGRHRHLAARTATGRVAHPLIQRTKTIVGVSDVVCQRGDVLTKHHIVGETNAFDICANINLIIYIFFSVEREKNDKSFFVFWALTADSSRFKRPSDVERRKAARRQNPQCQADHSATTDCRPSDVHSSRVQCTRPGLRTRSVKKVRERNEFFFFFFFFFFVWLTQSSEIDGVMELTLSKGRIGLVGSADLCAVLSQSGGNDANHKHRQSQCNH